MPSLADDKLRVLGGVAIGITELSFDEKLDADTTFNTYTLLGSVQYGQMFASVSFADSLGSENVSEEDETGSATRRDVDLTLGYRINNAWSIFLGYKDGETELDFRVRDSLIRQNERYAEDGWFAGTTYAWRFKKAGTLSFTAAYIRFDSDLKFSEGVENDADEELEDDAEELLEFDDIEGSYSADATGYSVGVNWVMPLSKRLAFRSQFKINQYDLEVKAQGQRFKPDQRLAYFDIGLLFAF